MPIRSRSDSPERSPPRTALAGSPPPPGAVSVAVTESDAPSVPMPSVQRPSHGYDKGDTTQSFLKQLGRNFFSLHSVFYVVFGLSKTVQVREGTSTFALLRPYEETPQQTERELIFGPDWSPQNEEP